MKIAILGMGGVGTTLAALLIRAGHSVTCIVRPEKFSGYPSTLLLSSGQFGKIEVRPFVATGIVDAPEVLFLATKAYDLKQALESIVCSEAPGLVVPLVNGHEHMQLLYDRFGTSAVAAGALSVEAQLVAPGVALHTSPFIKMVIGAADDGAFNKAAFMRQSLKETGIEIRITRDPQRVIWEKLVRLNALACITARSGEPIGVARQDSHWRSVLEQLVVEGVRVSCALGVYNTKEKVLEELDSLPASLTTSLARDIALGRRSELDAIAGGIVRMGRTLDIECPSIFAMIQEISAM